MFRCRITLSNLSSKLDFCHRKSLKSLADPLIFNIYTGKLTKLSTVMNLPKSIQTQYVKNSPNVCYAVFHNDKTTKNRIFDNWQECKAYTDGRKGVVYKKFDTSAIAQQWLHGKEHIFIPSDAETVYTDGACSNNQIAGKACGGIGVYFGEGDSRNLSEPLEGERQTNQRAELTAAIRAIEMQNKSEKGFNKPLLIITDSTYVETNATSNLHTWAENGYIKKDKEQVANLDLWVKLKSLIDARKQFPVIFKWVKGHEADIGNIRADKLAVEGAKKSAGLKRKQIMSKTPIVQSIVSKSSSSSSKPLSKPLFQKPQQQQQQPKKSFVSMSSIKNMKNDDVDEYERNLLRQLDEYRRKKQKIVKQSENFEFIDD